MSLAYVREKTDRKQWNPSVEYQAMDRIHRLGQRRPVKVVKLVVEDSIEDQACLHAMRLWTKANDVVQIVQLQHKKLAMTEAALSTDPDAALGKLTVEDVSQIGRPICDG